MKIYTIFTDSHSSLLNDYFLPSLKANIDSSIEIIVDQIQQFCPSAVYGSHGWFETMLLKAQQHIRACEENFGDKFIYSDCDVQFFKPFFNTMIEELEDYDIACQDDVHPYGDRNTYCAGLFICNANENTLNFFKSIYHSMIKAHEYDQSYNDQTALNGHLHHIKHKLLSSKFYTIAQTTKCLWNNEIDIQNIPSNLLVHHANWTHGIENKIQLLQFIKSKQQ
jgi:hypothetical protein